MFPCKCKKCGKLFNKPSTSQLRYHLIHAHNLAVPSLPAARKRPVVDENDNEQGPESKREDDPGIAEVSCLYLAIPCNIT